MGGDEGSVNTVVLTGKQIHAETGDTIGGTTLNQCVPSLTRRGIKIELHVGSNVTTPWYVAYQLQLGRCVIAQGNTRAFLPNSSRDTGTAVNHAVMFADARGGTTGEPAEVLMYDPAADGRKAGWGTAAKGPQWIPWSRAKAFFAALRPNGDNEPVLGSGKVYCAILPDTKPHVHLKYGGTRASPFPDRTRVDNATVWLRTSPAMGVENHVRRLTRNTLFVAYQRVNRGGYLWLGNHDGSRWVRASSMRNIGGTT
jgi:hypothetical protein